MAPNHCFMHPGLAKQRAKRGACPSKAAGQPLWAVGAARKAHGLCELPREHSLAPARPESDLKYETNGLNSPLEGCCSTRVPAAAFQPFLAATHCRNRDAVFPHTVRACFGETRGELIVCGLGCAGGCRWVHASSDKTRAVVTTSKSSCKRSLLPATFEVVTR